MSYVTYENHSNPHITIHLAVCRQIRKRGGEHKHGRGEYHDHPTYTAAHDYAVTTDLKIVVCSFCKPSTATQDATDEGA